MNTWYLVYTLIKFATPGVTPEVIVDTWYKGGYTYQQCVAARDTINRDPNNATFAECFERRGQGA